MKGMDRNVLALDNRFRVGPDVNPHVPNHRNSAFKPVLSNVSLSEIHFTDVEKMNLHNTPTYDTD